MARNISRKTVHLKSLEGKSKSEKKAIRENYDEAMNRLEKAQAKYVQKPAKSKKTGPISKKEQARLAQKKKDRYNQRVWKGWRDSDGKASPVKVYKATELED